MSQNQLDVDTEIDAQQRMSAGQSLQAAASKEAVRQTSRRKNNPQFVDKLSELDIETDVHEWVEDELKPWLARPHMFSRRRPLYEQQRELLEPARAEREIARHNPGRLMKKHSDVFAAAQNVDWSPEEGLGADPDAVEPWTPAEREIVHDVAEVSTARKALSVDAEGIRSLTSATTEHVQRREDEREARGITASVAEVFK